jgi:hypothetical protein
LALFLNSPRVFQTLVYFGHFFGRGYLLFSPIMKKVGIFHSERPASVIAMAKEEKSLAAATNE